MNRETEGTLHGILTQDGDDFVLIDRLTGRQTRCSFDGGMKRRAPNWISRRVEVYGTIAADRRSIRATSIYVMRERHKLPQIEDLHGIDITGGVEASEYVRGLRDED